MLPNTSDVNKDWKMEMQGQGLTSLPNTFDYTYIYTQYCFQLKRLETKFTGCKY